jgi:hypothetical protein
MEERGSDSDARGVTVSLGLHGPSAANLRRVGLAVEFIENNLEGDLSVRPFAGLVHAPNVWIAGRAPIALSRAASRCAK